MKKNLDPRDNDSRRWLMVDGVLPQLPAGILKKIAAAAAE